MRERLVELVQQSGMTQAEIARRVGEAPTWISNRLTGYSALKADDLPRIAAALGVSPCAFFEGAQPQPTTVRLDAESIERIGEAVGRQRVELAPESVQAVAEQTARLVEQAMRHSTTEIAHLVAERVMTTLTEQPRRPWTEEEIDRLMEYLTPERLREILEMLPADQQELVREIARRQRELREREIPPD